ncbi:MAG: glycosyltransferase family 4 protein [Flavobacteriaceae bacterium]
MFTKKSLKIFVDGYLLNKEPQGTKTYIKELYKSLASLNNNIEIYIGCFKEQKVEEEFKDYNNIHFIYFKQRNRFLRMLFEIPKLLKVNTFDFAHFQYVIPFARNKNCNYIVTIHDILFNDYKQYFTFLYRLKRNFLFKYSAVKSDYLLTVSEYSKQRIKEIYKLENKPIYVIPNGVSEVFFQENKKEVSEEFIKTKYNIKDFILYVSRVEPRKNQQQLLNSFSKMKNKDLSLVFIGKKSLENKELDKVYISLSKNVKERVYFLEDILEKDLIEFFRAAKAFVYPSLAEGFGIPPIEAAAIGLPVLCSSSTAMKDFNFFKPYHINFLNTDDVENYIDALLNDKDYPAKRIQKIVKDKYTWKSSAMAFSKILLKK